MRPGVDDYQRYRLCWHFLFTVQTTQPHVVYNIAAFLFVPLLFWFFVLCGGK